MKLPLSKLFVAAVIFAAFSWLPAPGQGMEPPPDMNRLLNNCITAATINCQTSGEMPVTWNEKMIRISGRGIWTEGGLISCSQLVTGCTGCQDIGNCTHTQTEVIPTEIRPSSFAITVYIMTAILALLAGASAYIWIKRKKRPTFLLVLTIAMLILLIYIMMLNPFPIVDNG